MTALEVFLVVALSWAGIAPVFAAIIVNGTKASDAFPYMVSIQKRPNQKWGHSCGGSIITTRHVITAAHCYKDPNFPLSSMSIWAGTTKLNGAEGQRFGVDSIVRHPKYVAKSSSDIAIIKTSTAFVFGKHIKPIQYSVDFIDGGVDVFTLGWGRVHPENVLPRPNNLQYLKLQTLTNQQCVDRGRKLDNTMMCSKRTMWRGTCNGDSGGPLVRGDRLVGITSFGKTKCGTGRPDVFVRIAPFYKWIQKNTQVAKTGLGNNKLK